MEACWIQLPACSTCVQDRHAKDAVDYLQRIQVRKSFSYYTPPALMLSRSAVEARGQFAGSGRSEGNENRRWHGTRRVCNLGDKGQTQFCSSTSCSLCCIIQNSFDISLWGKKTGWGRFGKGIYTSSTSSKSNDYSHNDCKSDLKTILLNKVVVGKGCKMLQDHTSLTAPPAGFDSVRIHFVCTDCNDLYSADRSLLRKGVVLTMTNWLSTTTTRLDPLFWSCTNRERNFCLLRYAKLYM